MFKEDNMEETKAQKEENTILNVETGGEKKTDGDAEDTEEKSMAQAEQTELLNQINAKMDELLAVNNISL